MKRRASVSSLLFTFLLSLSGGGSGWTDVPARVEQFIYTVVAYDGKGYGGTFVREPSDTLYLMADADNLVSARKSLVYFWPITREYKLDTDSLDQRLEGTLRIEGRGRTRTISPEKYTMYALNDGYRTDWKVAWGDSAEEVIGEYRRLVEKYLADQAAYERDRSRFREELGSLSRQAAELQAAGKDATSVMDRMRSLREPVPPEPERRFETTPSNIDTAFVVNLPAGRYRMTFISSDGTIMQGSEKDLVVFESTGRPAVGYEVIPGDKWTRPSTSSGPDSVLYVNGTTDLFLRPFHQKQYNNLFYRRLLNNDGRGNRNTTEWAKLHQVPRARLELRRDERVLTTTEEPFIIEQLQGSTLGYRIIPWVSASQHGRQPDLVAHRMDISRTDRRVVVTTVDEQGRPLPGSRREIRIIPAERSESVLILLVFLPVAALVVALFLRRRYYADTAGTSG